MLRTRALTGKITGSVESEHEQPMDIVYARKLVRQQRRVAVLEQRLKSLHALSDEPRKLICVKHLGTNHPSSRYDGWVLQKRSDARTMQDATNAVQFEARRGASYNATMRQSFSSYRRFRRDPLVEEDTHDPEEQREAPPVQSAWPSTPPAPSPGGPRRGSPRSARRYHSTGQHLNGTGGIFARRMRPRTAAARLPVEQTAVTLSQPLCRYQDDELVVPARVTVEHRRPEPRVYAELAGSAELSSSSPHVEEQRKLKQEAEYWERRRALASFARKPNEMRRSSAESAPASARGAGESESVSTHISLSEGAVLSPRARLRFDLEEQTTSTRKASADAAALDSSSPPSAPTRSTAPAVAALRYRDLFVAAHDFVDHADNSPRPSPRGTRALTTILGFDPCNGHEEVSSDYSPRSIVARHDDERADALLIQRAAARLGFNETESRLAAGRSSRATAKALAAWVARRDAVYIPPSAREFRPHISMSSPRGADVMSSTRRPQTAKP